MQSHIDDAENVLGMPVVFAEFGVSAKDKNFSAGFRDQFIGAVYKSILNSTRRGGGGAGSLLWQLFPEGTDYMDDGYAVVLTKSASTSNILSLQSKRIQMFNSRCSWRCRWGCGGSRIIFSSIVYLFSRRIMDFPAVKRSLEKAAVEILPTPVLDALPSKFYEVFILYGLSVDLIEPGRLLCSMAVPSRLLNSGNFLHGGATISLIDIVGSAAFYTVGARSTGSPLEMSTSFLDSAFVHEEIEIEAKVLRTGKNIGVANIDLRKKKNGRLFAQARFTKFLGETSKM